MGSATLCRWRAVIATLCVLCAPASRAAADSAFFGLLRARDLTPFGFLRLDMRPSHAISVPPGTWAIEMELAYQNTWALSEGVERYLSSLPGRRELGAAELQSILDLPGENYLVDVELSQLDVTVHHKLTPDWGAYLTLSGAAYSGGFLDAAIEQFHDVFGFSTFGRPAAARNDVNMLFDLQSMQSASFEAPTNGGLLDPTIGVRYSGAPMPDAWNLVLEAAVKLPIEGRRPFLSTGRTDFGIQGMLQRVSKSHALYIDVSAVYYAGTEGIVPSASQILPTLVLGYERRLTPRTNAILQTYTSPSVYSRKETELEELLKTKYQLSLGIRHRTGPHLFSFAVTENLQNFNNTPDIGFQFGWARNIRSGARTDQKL